MVRETKYIIRRILIGVGIALVMMFLKTNVFAFTSSWGFGSITETFDSSYNGFLYQTTGTPWIGQGDGHLHFSFTVTKVSGTSIASNSILRQVVVTTSDNNQFACDVGNVAMTNSTFNNGLYSINCPLRFETGSYLKAVAIYFEGNGNLDPGTYRLNWNGLMTFEQTVVPSFDTSGTTNAVNNQISNDNSNTQNIINNNNSNTQDIIDNQNSNTQDIIDNQNSNTEKEIESQKACKKYDISSIEIDEKYLNSQGQLNGDFNSGVSNYIPIDENTDIFPLALRSSQVAHYCFYNVNKTLISCSANSTLVIGTKLSIPNGASYVRFSFNKSSNAPQYKVCKNGNQAIVDSQNNINDTLNNDDVSGANSEASSFFSDFSADSHGLSGIITSPLRLIQGLSSATCSSLVIPLPFVSQNASIPCMSTIYSLYPTFYNLWQLLTTGLIAYWIIIKIFGHVKGMQDPNDDRIEVVNL